MASILETQSEVSGAEFREFRFLRDLNGEVVEVLHRGTGERHCLVFDCHRRRLVGLHLYHGRAYDEKQVALFHREMEAVRRLRDPAFLPIFSHDREQDDLFYTDHLPDGELFPAYLERNGALPPELAVSLGRQLLRALQSGRELPRAVENFSLENLFLRRNVEGGLDLLLGNFSGWEQPCIIHEGQLVARCALVICSWLTGRQVRDLGTFHGTVSDAIWSRLPGPLAGLVKDGAASGEMGGPFSRLAGFANALAALELPEVQPVTGAWIPRPWLYGWLLNGAEVPDLGPDYIARRSPEERETPYLVSADSNRGFNISRIRFQLVPGEPVLPKELLLEQHRAVLRRPGRGLPNQMTVHLAQQKGRAQFLGEERVEGVSLEGIVGRLGPLSADHALTLMRKISAALDAIEKAATASQVWWLPPENVYVVTGGEGTTALSDALQRFGRDTWSRLAVRLRLHSSVPALLRGLDLPDSLLRRMSVFSRQLDGARRTAVLMNLFLHATTGRRLSWEGAAPGPGDFAGLSPEVSEFLGATWLRLTEFPEKDPNRFLDDLARVIGASSNATDGMTALADRSIAKGSSALFLRSAVGEPEPWDGGSSSMAFPKAFPAAVFSAGLAPQLETPEPTVAESTAAESTAAEPTAAEPTAAEPTAAEPTAAEPTAAEPTAAEPTAAEPTAAEPTAAEPTVAEPIAAEPIAAEPIAAEPIAAEPIAAEPIAAEPIAAEPIAAEPTVAEPTVAEPTVAEPTVAEPTVAEPTVAEPTVAEPTVAEPTVAEPTVAEPTAAELTVPPPVEPVVATVPPTEKKSSLLTGHTGPVKLSALFASLSEQDMVPPMVPVAPVMRFGSPEPVHAPADVEPLGVIGENGLEPVTAIAGPEPVASVVSPPEADDSEMEHLGTIGDDEWGAWSGTVTSLGASAVKASPADQPTGESVQSARLSAAETREVPEPSVSFEHSPVQAVPAPMDSDVNRTFGDLAPFFAGRDGESAKLSPLPRASGTVPGKVQVPVESLPPAEKRKVWDREPGDSEDVVEATKTKSAGWLFGGRETMDPPPGGIAPPYGFGERLMTQKTFAGSDHALFPKDEEEKPARNLTRFWLVGLAVLAALGVAGVFLGQYISRFAGAIALEAHAEMLLPAHYTVQMEVSDALEDSLSQATGILPNLNDIGKGIAAEKPSLESTPSGDSAEALRDRAAVACQAARAARNRGEYAEAVGHYLEALRADSRQSDALKEIWATTREWQAAGVFEMTSGQLAQVEQTARDVPIAAALLAEYLLPRDPADGLRWLVRSAEAGHAPHMVRLGRLFAGGKVVPRDLPTAAAWFRKASEKGDASGQFYYSECLIFGKGLPESVFPGYDFLKKAQQGGESRAWNLMGTCHINGWGCQRDKIEALRCFEKAAESRDPGSYYNLGVRYAKGDGASRDLAKAADCFRQGAEAGDAFTMHIYAECLGLGFGVGASPVASQGWHVKAAQAGSSESQAWCDAHGVPVPK